jgi:STE24 endopeptidase
MEVALITVYLVVIGVGHWLTYLNLIHLRTHGDTVPPEFKETIDPALMKKMSAYTVETSRLGSVESMINSMVLLIFLFGGLLGVYDRWISSLSGSFVVAGALFALVLIGAETLLDAPFSLYRNFKIEGRYGFNAMTLKLWAADLAKSLVISAVLGTMVTATVLSIVQASPAWWWLWVWAFLLVFGIFMMYVSPYLIEPLFFKFEPVESEGLDLKIRKLMERAGLKVSRVFQVDASRRSRHSNAYFTGIGKVKRIVLFDTLVEQMSHEEILAVLAHEVGHWRKKHVLKRMVMTEVSAFLGLLIAFLLIGADGLPRIIGLHSASFYARMVIVGFLGSLVLFPLTPLFSYLSRRDEREADRFASELTGDPGALASALVRLSRENLANLYPHPWYAKMYYSHPPVIERIKALRRMKEG